VFTFAYTYAIRATPFCELPPPTYNNYLLYVVSFFICRAASVSIRLGALERALSKFAIPLSKLESRVSNQATPLSDLETPLSNVESRLSKLPNRQVKFAITLLNTLIINKLRASTTKASLRGRNDRSNPLLFR